MIPPIRWLPRPTSLRHCVDNISCPRIIRARNATARTPDQVVDTIIAWFEGGAADGFNIMAAALPGFGRTVKKSSHIRIGAEHPARVDPKDRSLVLVVASP